MNNLGGVEMSIEEWPEGATHYCPECAAFDDLKYGEHWVKDGFYIKRGWVEWKVDTCRAPSAVLIPLPTKPAEWDGEGLPPVGVEVEFKYGSKWIKCEVIALHKGRIVAVANETDAVGYLDQSDVRPIPSTAQIEAEKREATIDKAATAIRSQAASVNYVDALLVSAALYDAGLLRVEE